MAIVKVRPYLSVEALKHIVTSLAEDTTPLGKEIKSNLNQIIIKYDAGFVKGSYVARPRASIESSLGLSDAEEQRYLNGEMTPDEEERYTLSLVQGLGS